MNGKLFAQGISKFLAGLLAVGLLLFLPAGAFRYTQAWLLIGILFAPMLIAGLIMMRKNPELLKKRLNAREKESEQRGGPGGARLPPGSINELEELGEQGSPQVESCIWFSDQSH